MATFIRETGLKERHKGNIYGVYVPPAFRRRGVGRQLIATLIEKAKQDSSLEQILLAVATCQHAAKQLYTRLRVRDLRDGAACFEGGRQLH